MAAKWLVIATQRDFPALSCCEPTTPLCSPEERVFGQPVTLEGRIKRLEIELDHPANPGPDPETVAHWASLWIALEIEESQATAFALEFLLDCQAWGQTDRF